MYGKRGSNASESEQDDSVGNQADREIDSQVKEAVESDETIGCEQISSCIVFFCKIGGQYTAWCFPKE